MTQWARWRSCLRSMVLVALVLVMAAPVVFAGAADDVATVVQAQLPPGTTVTFTQTADIGGDGQMEAIFKAQSPSPIAATLNADVVGIAMAQGGTWLVQYQSMPFADGGTAANIYIYPKNDQHPGFVITNQHICGANCNGGTSKLLQYRSGKFTEAYSGINDRGNLTADPATGTVTLTGPVYAHADPRCCAEYGYTHTWTWQGTNLVPGTLSFAPAPDKTVPAWLMTDGARLVMNLNGFVAPPTIGAPVDAAAIAPFLADHVQVRDAANTLCVASKDTIAAALAQGITSGTGAVWPAMDGYSFTINWNGRALPNGVMADGCTLDAGSGCCYILHLTPTATGFVGDRLYATPQIYTNIPGDAIQLPPM